MERQIVFKLSLVLLTILLIGSVSASLGIFDPESCVNVVTILNGTTEVNLTIYYPNNTLAENSLMTANGNRYSHEFCTTSLLGTYNYDYFDDTGGSYVNDFKIGYEISVSQSIIYFIFLIASILTFGFCFYYAIKIKWYNDRDEDGFILKVNDLKYIKVLLVGVCYVMILFIFGLLRSITAHYIPELGVVAFFDRIFWVLFYCLYPILIVSVLIAVIVFLTDKKLKQKILKGIPTE